MTSFTRYVGQGPRLADAMHRRVLSRLWQFELRAMGVEFGAHVELVGRPIVTMAESSSITIGPSVRLISRCAATALGTSRPIILRTMLPYARLAIGADTGMSGTVICAARSVSVGERVLVGADVVIADTDFHRVEAEKRRYAALPQTENGDAIIIEDDVFIGARAMVLKGARVGAGSVIGAGSIVTSVIPAGVVAAGNPCRVIRELAPRN